MADNHEPQPDSADESAIEDLVFHCLSAQDPAAELERLAADRTPAFRELAARVLRGVQAEEKETSAPPPRPTNAEGFIGGCRILQKLATGGMGTVYLAEQQSPVRRRVALKVIRTDMISEMVMKRFELERQALALMDHDNIAKIFEAGTTDDGEPFFLMEFVPGQPIHDYCDRNTLSTRERLELFIKVCEAVQHAHQRGIIHRDLKSSNILVTDTQNRPVPKVIDFGLARATAQQLQGATLHTQHGMLLGTPAYMSPEQAETSSNDIDTRTDIYSLGVVLYELLTGSLPLTEEDLRGSALEIQRKVSEGSFPRPSTRISVHDQTASEVAKKRRSSIAALSRALRTDLDWIVMKALERDRSRRYSTASEFGADVRRYLDGEPVLAGPPDLGYRIRKFARRHRGSLSAAALVLISLVAGTIVSTKLYFEMRANAEEAARQKLAAQASERDAKASLSRFQLARYRIDLDDAIRTAGALYPAWPSRVGDLQDWLATNDQPLRQARTVVEDELDRIAASADPQDSATRFLLRLLRGLRTDLDAFTAAKNGTIANIRERLEWAEQLRERTITRHKAAWQRARVAILRADGETASPLYRTDPPLDLAPQIGLVPIGKNPVTGLWEFYHPRSAADPNAIPRHAPDGSIPVDADTGIVFVLVPGGRFFMGTQRISPERPNFDPETNAKIEGPPREVAVEPFFLARHELTQGQWLRLAGQPSSSMYRIGFTTGGTEIPVSGAHPIENTKYDAAMRTLERHGLTLPTERWWARACRAGTRTRWSTGDDAASLAGHANLLDRTAFRWSPGWGKPENFDDTYVIHAPVGSFKANPFGMHDMYGNVWELCRAHPEDKMRTARGGAFHVTSRFARTGMRRQNAPQFSDHSIGVRAARKIYPQ